MLFMLLQLSLGIATLLHLTSAVTTGTDIQTQTQTHTNRRITSLLVGGYSNVNTDLSA